MTGDYVIFRASFSRGLESQRDDEKYQNVNFLPKHTDDEATRAAPWTGKKSRGIDFSYFIKVYDEIFFQSRPVTLKISSAPLQFYVGTKKKVFYWMNFGKEEEEKGKEKKRRRKT